MAAGAEEEMTVEFHHNCGRNITLSDKNTTAVGAARVAKKGTQHFSAIFNRSFDSPISRFVLSNVPVQQLPSNRFMFKTTKKAIVPPVWHVGVTRSDPDVLRNLKNIAQTWCIEPQTGVKYENSEPASTSRLTGVTQYEEDVWCVEVTPGGLVYIYHNYSQPWGSPVFTLPSDTTQVWAVVTLVGSTVSVVQNCDTDIAQKIKAVPQITDIGVRAETALEIFHFATPLFNDMTSDTKTDIMSIILVICMNTDSSKLKDFLFREEYIGLLNEILTPLNYLKYITILIKDGEITINYLKSLMQSWNFADDGQQSAEPGFALALLHVFSLCFKTNLKTQDSSGEFDSILGPLVNQTLKSETTTSINSKDENDITPLIHAAQMLLPSVIKTLLQHPDIDVNITDRQGQTPLMILVEQGQQTGSRQGQMNHSELADLIHVYTRHEQFDPNVKNIKGNTVLFYMSSHLKPSDFLTMAIDRNIEWDYSIRNNDGDKLLDYYLKLPIHHDLVSTKLREASETNSSSSGNKRPIFRKARQITLNRADVVPTATNYACTTNFFASKIQMIQKEIVYDLTKAEKGKVFIISLTEFLVPWLSALPGYDDDRKNLTQFWSDVGFDVFCPDTTGSNFHQLTAKEIEISIRSFADMLEVEDQCAILVILTHGGEGFIYGSDGRKVYIRQMLQQFDNHSCIKMAGKPKIIIIQACQGESLDMGVYQRAAPSSDYKVAAAVDEPHLPLTSDMIVCVPAMRGYASFVRNNTDAGSIFIKCLMKTFKQRIGTDDIYTILTMVNREMSRGGVDFYRSGTAELQKHKQMSRFESCLTKLLFFFPAAGGKTGQDWK